MLELQAADRDKLAALNLSQASIEFRMDTIAAASVQVDQATRQVRAAARVIA